MEYSEETLRWMEDAMDCYHWTHSPDEQLRRIIAPWHGWSVYGRPRENGTGWTSAVDLCKEENARDLMGRTERTIATVQRFLSGL